MSNVIDMAYVTIVFNLIVDFVMLISVKPYRMWDDNIEFDIVVSIDPGSPFISFYFFFRQNSFLFTYHFSKKNCFFLLIILSKKKLKEFCLKKLFILFVISKFKANLIIVWSIIFIFFTKVDNFVKYSTPKKKY